MTRSVVAGSRGQGKTLGNEMKAPKGRLLRAVEVQVELNYIKDVQLSVSVFECQCSQMMSQKRAASSAEAQQGHCGALGNDMKSRRS